MEYQIIMKNEAFYLLNTPSMFLHKTMHLANTLRSLSVNFGKSFLFFSSLCVWTSNSAWRNQSCACWNHIRACRNHNACRNYSLRVGITLERVEITLVSVIFTRIRFKSTLVCFFRNFWNSDFALEIPRYS
jgi:hypothetical protein